MADSAELTKASRLPGLMVYSGLAALLSAVPIAVGTIMIAFWMDFSWWQSLGWGSLAFVASTLGGISMLSGGLYFDGRQSTE